MLVCRTFWCSRSCNLFLSDFTIVAPLCLTWAWNSQISESLQNKTIGYKESSLKSPRMAPLYSKSFKWHWIDHWAKHIWARSSREIFTLWWFIGTDLLVKRVGQWVVLFSSLWGIRKPGGESAKFSILVTHNTDHVTQGNSKNLQKFACVWAVIYHDANMTRRVERVAQTVL